MKFTQLKAPLQVSRTDMRVILANYPYDVRIYKDLCLDLRLFITRHYKNLSNVSVSALSAHNGKGRQWGVVLLKPKNEVEWKLVATFGHHVTIPLVHRLFQYRPIPPFQMWPLYHRRSPTTSTSIEKYSRPIEHLRIA